MYTWRVAHVLLHSWASVHVNLWTVQSNRPLDHVEPASAQHCHGYPRRDLLNDVIFFCIPCSVSTVTVYTRSFSFWSIACIEPTLPRTTPVSEMAVKSMGTNEIKLLGGSEEQMIFLWLITHCKRICAGHIASESISLPRLVPSGWDEENKAAVMVFVWGSTIWQNIETRTNGFVCTDVSMLHWEAVIMKFAAWREPGRIRGRPWRTLETERAHHLKLNRSVSGFVYVLTPNWRDFVRIDKMSHEFLLWGYKRFDHN